MMASRVDVGEMFFSQHSLGTFDDCALKFRRRYIDGLYWPGNWAGDREQMQAIEEGQAFHLAANRYYSEIPVGTLEEPVKSWFDALRRFRPREEPATYLPEQEIRMDIGGLRLLVKLDLLMVTPDGRGVIYDWKTGPHRPTEGYYARNIQTIVYRFVLTEAGGEYSPRGEFLPRDISMIYWNPRHPGTVNPLGYTAEDCELDERMIREKIEAIKGKGYDEYYATGDTKKCAYCEYAPICHGINVAYRRREDEEDELDLDWESIEEFALE